MQHHRAGPVTPRVLLSAAIVVAALGVVAYVAPALALSGSPSVSAVWPRTGPVGGGTAITVVGSGFTGATTVTIDGAPATSFTVVSDTLVQATAPASPTGGALSGAVVVTTGSGGASVGSALDSYAYVAGGSSVAVPSYIYPGAAWTNIDAGHPPVDLAVINPASGPGTSSNADYATQVATSQGAGVDVIGYVYTSYGSVPLSTVESEITEYESWYHVNGIFVDEASTSCGEESSYYAPLYAFIHSQTGLDLTVLNPGTFTPSCYLAAADLILAFEGDPADLAQAGPLPSWAAPSLSSRFWGVAYDVPAAGAASALATLAADGYGQVYVTDAQLPNPYGVLASYWTQELTDALGTTTTTGSTTTTTGSTTTTTGSTTTTSTTASTTTTTQAAGVAPRITSASSYSVSHGTTFSFTITTTGSPTPTVSVTGNLPRSLTVTSGTAGTATISGSIRRANTYRLTVTATNGIAPTATQAFTLTAT